MATRSGGSGTLISLVVFVILTVMATVAAIYSYSERNKAVEEQAKAQSALRRIISEELEGREQVQELISSGVANGQNLVEYMLAQQSAMANLVTGDSAAQIADVRTALALADDQTAKQALEDARRDAAASKAALADKVGQLEAGAADLVNVRAELDAAQTSAKEQIAQLSATIAPYRQAHERAMKEIEELKAELVTTREEARTDFLNQLAEERTKQDAIQAENQLLKQKSETLQAEVDKFRVAPPDPTALVDGTIVDLATTKGQVYISLGKKDHLRPGMTFEVFADPAMIMYDPVTHKQAPGKASLEVTRVGDTTSTARITRQPRGSSVQRGDVLANAVYSPNYKYKFLVHGRFDIDSDGKSSKDEADFIRGKIAEWGGIVVDGDVLTPDVDFVVVGEVPIVSNTGSLAPGSAAWSANMQAQQAAQAYDALVASARTAHVPVLNWNRFQILTGAAER